ncbi:transcriptional regulator [Saccharothrix syringae]|uniref:Transcriptional regulator n=1 Tax=Saccharothrix syringae TaxID=103733 RepID=A0A5Q0HEG7_SACSY|nr:transcriptional regulator [Saccharothrix syringae]
MARALNLVGDRWALLVVRELLFGPKRFTDLRAGLPAASQNVLSHRLRELEAADVVRRRATGAPVYELTRRGARLRPVLLELARWGSATPVGSTAELSVAALLFALLTTFSPDRAGDLRGTFELRVDDEPFRVAVDGGRVDVVAGAPAEPDAVVDTDRATLRELVFGGAGLPDAVAAGRARVAGDEQAAARLLTLFPRPAAD